MLVDVLSVGLRALSFLALFQAAGIAIFIALLGHHSPASEPALRRLGMHSALTAGVLVFSHYVLEAARLSGTLSGVTDLTLQGVVLHSATGVALTWRLAGLLLIAIGLRSLQAPGTALGAAGAIITLAAFTFVGHTAASPLRWFVSLLLLAHLLFVAFWFGALAPLYVISTREPAGIAGAIVAEFSARAVWLVPLLLIAGLLLATALLPNPAALLRPYGRLLLLKLAGFLALMLPAALNRWRLGPALERGDRCAGRSFRRSLAAEYGLIAAILCVTAVLTTFYSPED